jgi:hypothetical protein
LHDIRDARSENTRRNTERLRSEEAHGDPERATHAQDCRNALRTSAGTLHYSYVHGV